MQRKYICVLLKEECVANTRKMLLPLGSEVTTVLDIKIALRKRLLLEGGDYYATGNFTFKAVYEAFGTSPVELFDCDEVEPDWIYRVQYYPGKYIYLETSLMMWTNILCYAQYATIARGGGGPHNPFLKCLTLRYELWSKSLKDLTVIGTYFVTACRHPQK